MKISLLWVFLFLMPLSAQTPLQSFQWKNRILVILMTKEPSPEALAVTETLKKYHAQASERNLIVIDISQASHRFPLSTALDAAARSALRKRFQVTDATENTFILIGKDGLEKSRQRSELKLQDFLTLIDSMPMRQQEQRTSQSLKAKP